MPSSSALISGDGKRYSTWPAAGDQREADGKERTDEALRRPMLMIVLRYRPAAMISSADAGYLPSKGVSINPTPSVTMTTRHRLSRPFNPIGGAGAAVSRIPKTGAKNGNGMPKP